MKHVDIVAEDNLINNNYKIAIENLEKVVKRYNRIDRTLKNKYNSNPLGITAGRAKILEKKRELLSLLAKIETAQSSRRNWME